MVIGLLTLVLRVCLGVGGVVQELELELETQERRRAIMLL